MKRKAFLIEASNLAGEPDLPGARIDVLLWKNLLFSYAGGAWDEDEMSVLSKPTWSRLQVLLAITAADYIFISFSGHGEHFKGHDLEESRIWLNEKERIAVNDIKPPSSRCTFVIDACRQLVVEKAISEMTVSNQLVRVAEYTEREKYRNLFEDAVLQAESGIIRLFSCDIGESAGESRTRGGFYTDALCRCCKEWHDETSSGERVYYSTWAAHSSAAIRTNQRQYQQHPQYEGGRRNCHFPLAVKP